MVTALRTSAAASPRFVIDIGSTVVKVARLDAEGELLDQHFHPRDLERGIPNQLDAIVEQAGGRWAIDRFGICSSANGGLRVGIVALSERFSGSTLRNQALLAGANPLFVHTFDDASGSISAVDILLLGGGIDCADAGPLCQRLESFDPSGYRFQSMLYCGNSHLRERVTQRFPKCEVVDNPLAGGVVSASDSVFDAIRSAYLRDLVHKEGISELRSRFDGPIWPTPEVVNRGFRRAIEKRSRLCIDTPALLIDIGGATTDLHYTVEMVADDSAVPAPSGESVARYVFTDLGIVASRDSALLQLRSHPDLYSLLEAVVGVETRRDVYRSLREGDFEAEPRVLSYACLFLALSRFSEGRGPGLPRGELGKVAQLVLTGGAVQGLDVERVRQVVALLLSADGLRPEIIVDREYRLWVEGILAEVEP